MDIISFKNINFTEIFKIDETNRNIGYSLLNDVFIVGRNYFYPNILLLSEEKIISPYDEKIMSLNKDSFYDNNKYYLDNDLKIGSMIINKPVFFLIYNFDNYYHFIYDTLPYLFTYLYLKKNIPDLKLLLNYPNKNLEKLYKFNTDFLEKIININDIIIHNVKDVYIYKKIYISTSLTHGGFSNNPPRKEIYQIYDLIKNNIKYENINEKYINLDNNFKKIYISRRTWINKDNSNLGTDYTTRRKMMNEDELVNELNKKGFIEIFAENLNSDEKIYLFSNADVICGSIGGGMANLLFSKNETKSVVFITPFFLDINFRFKYSLEHTDITYFNDIITHKENNKIPLYCRVKMINEKSKYFSKYGEIIEYDKDKDKYLVNISNNDVAGFNNNIKFDNDFFNDIEFVLLDQGLNSPYIIDINKLIRFL